MTTTTAWAGDAAAALPADGYAGTLVGRVWNPAVAGPSPVLIREDGVFDLSATFATVSALAEEAHPAAAARAAAVGAARLGGFDELYANTAAATSEPGRDPDRPWLLAPVDLQTLKAAGVTFAVSMIERVIEERVKGDADAAAQMRDSILAEIGTDLREVKPGSEAAIALKQYLVGEGLWSQYLEVGIGPDAEIFTKGPTLSAMGTATQVGVLSTSHWNNPEPEVALLVSSTGRIVGATLGNDVNLRDVEGRSALLLPKAKDNNASCALGPFIRLFDEESEASGAPGDTPFTLDTVRAMTVTLRIDGTDGFHLDGSSEMSQISRDPIDLVAQLVGPHHQYPDGALLMLGTMFAPIVDRDEPDRGFTHHTGDIVRISSAELGSLVNQVEQSERCEPWVFGIGSLMKNLASRNLL
ncbi:fumarylacetoacetate hydrolase family protein [Herbiconiux sp. CPCC 203407]|uniref:Fumarylacetoacetate hydrolase family protein n=1 Tax=Herbiconiux oxytropis TaxID=2970915 RepID=A0AA41XBV2_9MICO|nr:fumarylacetoacetate hydrolase family protein [Herbiconiux oxytropis]MCS5723121.1 fumarylacetoacetate hydrolase family protein [Herbiconiux oxytropis]MCS5725322.1 fumarylacetoacetate hydrolase family protein [Herbiconiux oxytropis]